MLKPTQKEPSWSYVLHFIIYFSHFSFSAISQACIHVRRNLESLHNHSISQVLFEFAEKWNGRVFKQLWNHSFIFNSYTTFVCWWNMLMYRDPNVNWFCILFFKWWTFSNKWDQNIAYIAGTESEVFSNKHAPSASLLFETRMCCFSRD